MGHDPKTDLSRKFSEGVEAFVLGAGLNSTLFSFLEERTIFNSICLLLTGGVSGLTFLSLWKKGEKLKGRIKTAGLTGVVWTLLTMFFILTRQLNDLRIFSSGDMFIFFSVFLLIIGSFIGLTVGIIGHLTEKIIIRRENLWFLRKGVMIGISLILIACSFPLYLIFPDCLVEDWQSDNIGHVNELIVKDINYDGYPEIIAKTANYQSRDENWQPVQHIFSWKGDEFILQSVKEVGRRKMPPFSNKYSPIEKVDLNKEYAGKVTIRARKSLFTLGCPDTPASFVKAKIWIFGIFPLSIWRKEYYRGRIKMTQGDVNHDGKNELIVSNSGWCDNYGIIHVYSFTE